MKKNTQLYSDKENVIYLLSNWWKWSRNGFKISLLRIPILILMPTVTALIPKIMIDCITNQVTIRYLMIIIVSLATVVATLSAISPYLTGKMNGHAMKIRLIYMVNILEKKMSTDYQNIESIKGREQYEKAKRFFLYGWSSSSQMVYENFVQFCTSIMGVFTYLIILSVLNPMILLLIFVTCLADYLFEFWTKRLIENRRDKMDGFFMRFDYFYETSNNIEAGKDVRIYGMKDWFIKIAAEITNGFSKLNSKYIRQTLKISSLQALMGLIRETIIYIYLICCVLSGDMLVSDFVFYFGLIMGFSSWTLSIVTQANSISIACLECDEYRKYIEMPDVMKNEVVSSPTARNEGPCEIECCDVSFAYSGSEKAVLKNVNFHVKQGEKIAVVGANGAGKTTLVKILCGFYRPTKGKILIDGQEMQNFNRDDYYQLFSAVFQDFMFLPRSIETNIALCEKEQIDQERIQEVLKQAGLQERINSLKHGIETNMIKEVYEDAENFSGGELQRLLLARALYKDAPVLILDEPTASLDPIAENELYEKYSDLTKNKTSFFISHRLSSTRFCDRILFISDGKVAEEGTHEELMKKQGQYWQMYEMQSYYYKYEKVGEDSDMEKDKEILCSGTV